MTLKPCPNGHNNSMYVNDSLRQCVECREFYPAEEEALTVVELPPDFVEQGYRQAFGETREQAQGQRICVMCKQHPTFTTEAGRREYEISGVCEPCFDSMFAEPEDDEG